MHRTLPILISTAIVLLGGSVHGIWTRRWTNDRDLEIAAARLDRVPMTIGDWEGQPLEFEVKDYARAGIEGGLSRRYVNRRNGDTETVLIVCGAPGPISVHTPEVCYPAAGYVVLGERVLATLPPDPDHRPAAFWGLWLRKQGSIAPDYLGIYYAWSNTGDWRAPDRDPRYEYAGSPYLYKMYVVRQSTSATRPQESDPSLEFIRALVPELRKSLFPSS